MQAANGTFYGTTSHGGTYGDGTVFSLSIGLGPFVETLSASGTVGKPVVNSGTQSNDGHECHVQRRGATFTVVSPTEIKTSVPRGDQQQGPGDHAQRYIDKQWKLPSLSVILVVPHLVFQIRTAGQHPGYGRTSTVWYYFKSRKSGTIWATVPRLANPLFLGSRFKTNLSV